MENNNKMNENSVYEWRTFNPPLEARDKIMKMPSYKGVENEIMSYNDYYFITNNENEILKIRNNFLKVKNLVFRSNEYEIWNASDDVDMFIPELFGKYRVCEIHKKRHMKLVNNCGAEVTYLRMNDKEFTSIGLESATKKSLLDMKKNLNLIDLENKNYAQFIMEVVR